MVEPLPLVGKAPRGADSAPLADLLHAARQVESWSEQGYAAGQERFLSEAARLDRSRQRTRMALVATACGGAVLAAALLAFLPRAAEEAAPVLAAPLASPPSPGEAPAWDLIELAGIGILESTRGALTLDYDARERRLRLDAGVLRAQVRPQDPRRPVVVMTPHLRVAVVGTRFDVQVDERATQVQVLEGKVCAQSKDSSVLLSGGESLRSTDLGPALGFACGGPWEGLAAETSAGDSAKAAPAQPVTRAAGLKAGLPARTIKPAVHPTAAPAAVPPAPRDCARSESHERRVACYQSVAEGEGLAAQNALYALGRQARDVEGQPERALAYWREYQRRFPSGSLAPEVALGVFELLQSAGRTEEAIEAAAHFEERFGDDPRADRVAMARARLLCESGRGAEGRALLEPLASRGRASTRNQAIDLMERCLPGVDSGIGPPDR